MSIIRNDIRILVEIELVYFIDFYQNAITNFTTVQAMMYAAFLNISFLMQRRSLFN